MGLLSGMMKAGVGKKLVDEARKPKNQQRIKDFVGSMTDRAKGGQGDAGGQGAAGPGAADGTQTRATVDGQTGTGTGTTAPQTPQDDPPRT